MNERERRIADNEILFREVNARIARANEEFGGDGGMMQIICECGDGSCAQQIEVSTQRYSDVRTHPARFIVVPGHVIEEAEFVVSRDDALVVVEKRDEAAQRAADRRPE